MRDIPQFARFWMICRKPATAGARPEPRQRYSRRDDAIEAAQRLATETGHVFLILETVASVAPDGGQKGLDL